MARYEIWDKASEVYTPGGAVYTPEEWTEKYGWIRNPKAIPVVSGGVTNGAFCGELSEMKQIYQKMGCRFQDSMAPEEVLAAIEEFEMNPPGAGEPSVEERSAAALEAIAAGQTTENANALNVLLGEA
ncbi:MAG: hypothetical protein HFE88_06665 [Acutalibacter sp.]|nr:hypothetical protein [Acutalibacter sp.]